MDLKIQKYTIKLEQNNKDGTKTPLSTDNMNIKQEMLVIELIDKIVEKIGVKDADKVFEYIKSK